MAYIELQYKSMALMRGVNVTVILPTDGMAGAVPEPPYKTLYMLPGYSATALEIVTYLGLRAQAELKGIAIVIPDGENLFYQDVTQLHTFYSTYVGKELVEMTRKMFSLSEKREDTYIGGISMGYFITRKAWNDPQKRAAAVEFVSQLTSDETLSTFVKTEFTALKSGAVPENLNSLEQSAADCNAALTGVVGAVQDRMSAAAKDYLFTNIRRIVTGKITPEKAIEAALKLNG